MICICHDDLNDIEYFKDNDAYDKQHLDPVLPHPQILILVKHEFGVCKFDVYSLDNDLNENTSKTKTQARDWSLAAAKSVFVKEDLDNEENCLHQEYWKLYLIQVPYKPLEEVFNDYLQSPNVIQVKISVIQQLVQKLFSISLSDKPVDFHSFYDNRKSLGITNALLIHV